MAHAPDWTDAGGVDGCWGPWWASGATIHSHRCMSEKAREVDGTTGDAHQGPIPASAPPASLHRRGPAFIIPRREWQSPLGTGRMVHLNLAASLARKPVHLSAKDGS